MGFESTFKKLTPTQQKRVNGWCFACGKVNGAENGNQVMENLKQEKNLKDTEMKSLLNSLNPRTPKNKIKKQYEKICETHQLKGTKANVKDIDILYRIVGETTFASIAARDKKEKGLDTVNSKKMLRRISHAKLLEKAKNIENLAKPGNVVWATFFETREKSFLENKMKAAEVFKILGLGHYLKEKGGYCYIYEKSALDVQNVPLHVPTVADAGFSQYFRPTQRNKPLYGETYPIESDIKFSMPEVVHENQPGSILSDIEYL